MRLGAFLQYNTHTHTHTSEGRYGSLRIRRMDSYMESEKGLAMMYAIITATRMGWTY